MKIKLLNLTIALLIVSLAFGQGVPQGINYQAVARDTNGNEITNQTLTVRISVVLGSSTGTISWQETHAVTTNDYGLFTAVIGEGVSTGSGSSLTFDAVNWGTANHYLKVEVDIGSGYIDMGTTQLMSVPYALQAGNAETLPSGNPNQTLRHDGSDWIAADNLINNGYSVSINTTNAEADNSSILDIVSNDKGILIPRMTKLQKLAIMAPATGLLVYQTDGVTPGFSFFNGISWEAIKHSGLSISIDDLLDGSHGVGFGNIFLGEFAGESNNMWGQLNIGFGYQSLRSLVDGDYNVACGAQSLRWNVSGSENVAIGYRAGYGNTGNGNIFIGLEAGYNESGSNKLYIHNNSSSNPLIWGDFANDEVEIDGELALNTDLNSSARDAQFYINADPLKTYAQRIKFENSGSGTMQGIYSLVRRTGGSGIIFGHRSYCNNDAGTASTYGIYTHALGASTGSKFGIYSYVQGSGNLYGVYAYSTSGYAGYFAGDVYSTGNYLASDESLKKNISDYKNALAQLNSIEVKEYEYTNEGDMSRMNLPKGKQVGLMAQNIENVFPQLTKETVFDLNNNPEDKNNDKEENLVKFKAVNYTGMIPVIVKAIQEQQEMIKEQQAIIKTLEDRITQLENK